MKRKVWIPAAFGAVVLLYLLLWPTAIDPVSWDAPAHAPSRWKVTGSLTDAERFEIDGHGPEDVEVDEQGRVYVGVEDGRVLRFDDPQKPPKVLANTKGRPLGLEFGDDGNLYVADAYRGLLVVRPSGEVQVLTSTCGGTKLGFADELDVAKDGTVWFSDASLRFPLSNWKMDIMESRPNGRLCKYDPTTKETKEVLKDLYFANGVAIDPGQQFVLFNETSRYRVTKLWIAGPRAGKREILIDNLPGFPDNLAVGSDGLFWLALPSQRNPAVDKLAPYPFFRKVAMRLPEFLQPKADRTARVMAFDENGKVIHDLFDPTGSKIYLVTGMREASGYLVLGSLRDTAVARVKIP